MTSPFGPLRLIVSPTANGGGVGRELPALLTALNERGLEHTTVEVAGVGEAERAAEAALDEGVRFVVVAGDDPTINGVVNGLLNRDGSPRGKDTVLGTAWPGSASDLPRTFGLDRPPEVVAKHLSTEHTMPIDVGIVELTGLDGSPARRLFANAAEVGWGAHLIRLTARLRRLGRVGRLLAAYGAIRALDRQETAVTVAHTQATLPVTELVVANGQFIHQAARIAPRALPDDGKFNVQVFTGDRSQMFVMSAYIYRGDHLPNPQIVEWQSPTVRIAPDNPLPVAADGILLGTTPAVFRIAHHVLQLKI
ncbi:MAG: diacylglycerol/lipid kinase family protein [Egibacteraceae bacterium]